MHPATGAAYLRELALLTRPFDVSHTGVAPAAVLTRARAAIDDRIARDLTDGMQFTFRNPARSTDPSRAVPGARSVFVAARPYLLAEPVRPAGATARVARYAWVDHYAPLRAALWAVAHRLRADGFKAVPFADDNSIVDREVAYQAGIGWYGKNANLLVPGAGSWFVLGCVVTTAPLPTSTEPAPDGCGSCRRCLDACPTGAIVQPGVVDAARCLAWVLQKPGIIARHLREAVGDRIYGCDDCQEVCPPNRLADRRGDGDGVHTGVAASSGRIDVLWMLHADDDELLAAAGRWYVPKRDPDHLRRNALLVLANTGDGAAPVIAATIERYLRHPNDVLAAHAAWAALRLGRADLLEPPAVAERAAVQAEMVAAATLAPTLAPTRAVPRD